MTDYERAQQAGARALTGLRIMWDVPFFGTEGDKVMADAAIAAALQSLFPSPGQYAVERGEDGEVVVLGRLREEEGVGGIAPGDDYFPRYSMQPLSSGEAT